MPQETVRTLASQEIDPACADLLEGKRTGNLRPLKMPPHRTSLAMTQDDAGRVFAYYTSKEEALHAARELGASTDPIVEELNKSVILGKTELDVTYGGKPYRLELSDKVCQENFLPPDEGLGQILAERNKVTKDYIYKDIPVTVFRIEISSYLPERLREIIGRCGGNSANCFNAALYGTGEVHLLEWTHPQAFVEALHNYTRITGGTQKGDIGVMYQNGIPVHAFVVIEPARGNANTEWIITKNGQGNLRPYQLQRLDDTLLLYPSSYIRYFRK